MITLLIRLPRFFLLLVFMSFNVISWSQGSLSGYIETGLKNNLVLQQKTISLEKALYSLKMANSLFLPSVGLKGDYQSGEGGRSISIPLGEMLNPVYQTLNQLTNSNAFPQISNAEQGFFPLNFYDLRIRTLMPIINTDLLYNHSIQKQQVTLQEYEVEIYRQELIKNIKVAYYNYLTAAKSISIYESALSLAYEGKRINESLLNHGKSVPAYLLRSESEIQNLVARKTLAIQMEVNARQFFNFLLNVNPDQRIDTTDVPEIDQETLDQYLINDVSVTNRTELKALEQTTLLYKTALKMDKAYWLPKLNGFLDLGSQASDWNFTNNSRYYFFGFQLDVPLFTGLKNTYKIKQSELNMNNQLLNNTYVTNQIQLSANIARNNLLTTYENLQASRKQSEASDAYSKLIEKGYKEGINTFIETIDARNQLVSASLQVVINRYQLMSALATYEREINK